MAVMIMIMIMMVMWGLLRLRGKEREKEGTMLVDRSSEKRFGGTKVKKKERERCIFFLLGKITGPKINPY